MLKRLQFRMGSMALIWFMVLGLLGVAFAQQAVTVKGTVTDQKGEALVGANVFIEDLGVGAATDTEGYFSFVVPAEKVRGQEVLLLVRFAGYKEKSERINLTETELVRNFRLSEDVFQSETIVVTGIASKTSKDVSSIATSTVSAANYTAIQAYQGVSQLVAGKVSGVQLQNSSGNVGSGFSFWMRSGGGLNGDEQPVIYVDGVRLDDAEIGNAAGNWVGGQGMSMLANLNPEEIEKIEILKGPAGASSYGTNGSNGVILISTKKGRLMPGAGPALSINYKYLYGINTQSHKYTEDEFISYKDANRIFRDGLIMQNTLDLAGGNSFVQYYAAIDKRREEGIIHNNFMDRSSFRANLTTFPSENVNFKINANYVLNELTRPQNDNNIYGYLGNTLLFPTSYGFTDSAAIAGLTDINKVNQFIGSAQLNWTVIPKMEFTFGVGIDNSDWRGDQTNPANLNYAFVEQGQRQIWIRRNMQLTYDFNGRYSYKVYPELDASTVMGIQIFDRMEQTSFLTSQVFSTELITDIGAGSTVTYWGEGKVNLRDAGLFAEQRFEYAEQYYLTLGLRNDYASSVGTKAPSIFYPSASFAIRLDRYGWLPTAFNLLKLRLAYGESGQLPGPRDPIPLLWGAANGGYGAGADLVGIGNTELKPETVKEFELGFETEFLTNYSAEFSYYHQNASNSIIGRNYAPSTGLTATGAPFNIGAMKNWGIESLLRATPLRAKNMELGLSLIWNYQTNEVTDLGGAQPIFDGFDVNVIKEGLAKHEFYTQKVIGALYDNDGNYTGPKIYETPDPTDDDRVSFGNPIPSHTGSFSVNFRFLTNVNLYILCDWALDRKIYNSTDVFATRWANNKEFNRLANLLGRAGTGEAYFTEPDPNINPLTPGTSAYNEAAEKYAKMDWRYDGNYVEDADFFKLREISISYSFINLLPMLKADRYIRDLTLGLSARNLFTSTPYTGADAEINSDGSRSLSRGSDFLTLQNPRVYNLWLRLAL